MCFGDCTKNRCSKFRTPSRIPQQQLATSGRILRGHRRGEKRRVLCICALKDNVEQCRGASAAATSRSRHTTYINHALCEMAPLASAYTSTVLYSLIASSSSSSSFITDVEPQMLADHKVNVLYRLIYKLSDKKIYDHNTQRSVI